MVASDIMNTRGLNEQEEEEEDNDKGDDYLSWNTANSSEKAEKSANQRRIQGRGTGD